MSALRRTPGAASATATRAEREQRGEAPVTPPARAHAGPGERLTSRRGLGPGRGVEELARVEAEQARDDHRREDLDQRVVGLDRVVVDAAGDRDLVLGLAQVVLELGEVLEASSSG